MAGREPKKKEHHSKDREPAVPSPSRRRPARVVLWDEAPDDDGPEETENDEASQ